jgi:acyl-CoA reductase-like NAD-dependent aldehyde dehydrogenase
MERVADLNVERRDGLALTLTLDQGKPLHSESHGEVDELVEYWRMAAADVALDGHATLRSTRRSGFSATAFRAASSA